MKQVIPRTVILAMLVGLVAILVSRRARSTTARESVQFNHKIHIEQGLDCSDCHELYRTQRAAGRPQMNTCALCHAGAATDNPELRKVVEAIAEDRELSWKRMTRLPSHVMFSHRRHVELAHLNCQTCHGPMTEATRPPSRPLKPISMEMCIRCHTERKVTNDCLACHR